MRAARAIRVLPTALSAALSVTAVTLAARKTFPDHLSDRRAWQILIGAAAVALISLLIAFLRRLPPRAGTIALDRHHDLHDRLTNALAFDVIAPDARSPLMEVAIDDACEHAERLNPRRASPIRGPGTTPSARRSSPVISRRWSRSRERNSSSRASSASSRLQTRNRAITSTGSPCRAR